MSAFAFTDGQAFFAFATRFGSVSQQLTSSHSLNSAKLRATFHPHAPSPTTPTFTM